MGEFQVDELQLRTLNDTSARSEGILLYGKLSSKIGITYLKDQHMSQLELSYLPLDSLNE